MFKLFDKGFFQESLLLLIILMHTRYSRSERCQKNYTIFDGSKEQACKDRKMIQRGVCMDYDYRRSFVKAQFAWLENHTIFYESNMFHACWKNLTYMGMTNLTGCIIRPNLVFTKINWGKLRHVNDKKRTITVDVSGTMYWSDKNLKTHKLIADYGRNGVKISKEDMNEIALSNDDSYNIWTPDIHVYNISDYQSFVSSIELVSVKVLKKDMPFKGLCIPGPIIKYQIQAQMTFYCNLDYTYYPRDKSTCRLRFGSTRSDLGFVLFNNEMWSKHYRSTNFKIEISTTKENEEKCMLGPCVGLDIHLTRFIQPYFLKYYLPCCMITCLSQCSFIIPLTALPGRVALTITQLLTLTSIFIQQMVRGYSNLKYNLNK